MSSDVENDFTFVPPVARPLPTYQAVTYPLDRPAFLRAVEAVIPRLTHPATGCPWEYDGYRRTRLFLVQPENRELGVGAYTVEFNLHFERKQTTVSVSSPSPLIHQLFHNLTCEVALMLLVEQQSGIGKK